jgi:hypothetical protein
LANQGHTIATVFETRCQAGGAIDTLWHAGFQRDQIGMAAPGMPTEEATTPTGEMEKSGARGAVAGSLTGGTVGAILGGLAAGLIPGIGQVLAGGVLAGVVTGAAAGAAGGTYLGPFFALGFSEDDARAYEQHLRAGRTIVTVKTDHGDDQVLTIVKSHGGRMVQIPKPLVR